MPLPAPDSPWPPSQFAEPMAKIAEWSAWYSNNPDNLRAVYGRSGSHPTNRPSQYRGGLVGWGARLFWGAPVPEGEPDERLHIPLAGDISKIAAALLFGDPATFRIPDDLTSGDRKATQMRLDRLGEQSQAPCIEAAHAASGLGGVYLRGIWDTTLRPDPWIGAVHADAAVPTFRYGELVEVTFWSVIKTEGNLVVRHLERHARGVIEHAAYEGTPDNLGQPVSLDRHTETADLKPAVETRIDLLTAAYIPNMRPTPDWRSLPQACYLGHSDYAGTEPVMDALDRAWSSLMRELDMGRARAIVAEYMLESFGVGQGRWFNADRRYFTPLRMPPSATGPPPITTVQPEIRVEEHLRLAQELALRAISGAGYSAQSFGFAGEVAITATESGNKREMSLVTTSHKGLYWRPGLGHMGQVVLQLGNRLFGWGVAEERPDVQLAEAAVDPHVVAETVDLLHRAEAISIEQRVRRVNPEWDDAQIAAEVARIKDERDSVVPAPDTFAPGASDPNAPPDDDPDAG